MQLRGALPLWPAPRGAPRPYNRARHSGTAPIPLLYRLNGERANSSFRVSKLTALRIVCKYDGRRARDGHDIRQACSCCYSWQHGRMLHGWNKCVFGNMSCTADQRGSAGLVQRCLCGEQASVWHILGLVTPCEHISSHTAATRASKLNLYDTSASHFEPLPDGPYEDPSVQDGGQPAAQAHFNATREIKLKDKHGIVLPPTTYR